MLALVLSSMLLAADPSYQDAYKEAVEKDMPLVVLVGADWCPHCRVMKSALKKMAKDGELDKVAVGLVNYDRETRLAKQLLTSTTIPELIVFRRRDGKWVRQSAIGDDGGKDPAALVRDLIK